jgi:hypothetical protein
MSDNPFQPPEADLGGVPQKPGSLLVGVLLGSCVDLGGSYFVGTVMFILYVGATGDTDLSGSQLQLIVEQYSELILSFDNVWSWTLLALGILCSMLGGYVCASKAQEKRVRALGIVATIMAVIGFQSVTNLEVGVTLVLCLITVAAIFQGGRLWAQRNPRLASKHD